ncbi:hypothetical protein [Thermincola ferriacetica]
MCLSDEVLIAQSKEGDVEAFTKLVAKYENKVYTIAYRFFGITQMRLILTRRPLSVSINLSIPFGETRLF